MKLKDQPFWAEVLDRPIAFHRCFVKVTGSVPAALMLSQATYWSQRTMRGDGWFYKTHEEWREETGLSRHQQVTARKLLRSTGVWRENRRGVPARLYYQVDFAALETRLRCATSTQDVRKADNCFAPERTNLRPESVQHLSLSETKTETTSENLGRYAASSRYSSTKKKTAQQKRFAIVSRLADRATELLKVDPKMSHGDLAEGLKTWAAHQGISYFDAWPGAASPIQQAITIAMERCA